MGGRKWGQWNGHQVPSKGGDEVGGHLSAMSSLETEELEAGKPRGR